jgi:splicing factor 3A subunit 3
MGWDGKPIPFWLYKLHGLGIQYPCEICGNYVYMGRKPFERHFSEWRHVYGLRCLGIPSSKQFHEITKIKDALACTSLLFVCELILLAVWEFLQVKQKEIKTKEESVEEFEDAHGNVYSKKTYEDLKRQGLL